MSKHKSHPLVDRTEPNFLEETFPYSLPPLICFDGPMIEYIDGKAVKFDPHDRQDVGTFSSPTRLSATASRPGPPIRPTRWFASTT